MISGQDRNAAKSLDRDIPALANARGRRALFVAVGLLLVLQGSANQESEGDSSREQYYDGEWQCLAFVDPHDGYVSTFVSSRAICTLNLRLHVTHAPTTGSQKSSRVSRSCSESTAWTLLLRGTSGPARARPPCRRPGASHAPSTNPRRALPGGRSATSRRRKTSRTTPRRSSRTLSSTCRLAPHRAPRPSVPRHARAHALRPRHVRSSRARTSSSTSPSPARTVRAPRPPPPPGSGGSAPRLHVANKPLGPRQARRSEGGCSCTTSRPWRRDSRPAAPPRGAARPGAACETGRAAPHARARAPALYVSI